MPTVLLLEAMLCASASQIIPEIRTPTVTSIHAPQVPVARELSVTTMEEQQSANALPNTLVTHMSAVDSTLAKAMLVVPMLSVPGVETERYVLASEVTLEVLTPGLDVVPILVLKVFVVVVLSVRT